MYSLAYLLRTPSHCQCILPTRNLSNEPLHPCTQFHQYHWRLDKGQIGAKTGWAQKAARTVSEENEERDWIDYRHQKKQGPIGKNVELKEKKVEDLDNWASLWIDKPNWGPNKPWYKSRNWPLDPRTTISAWRWYPSTHWARRLPEWHPTWYLAKKSRTQLEFLAKTDVLA